MRFIINIFLTALLAALATWYLPWWTVAIVSFIVALLLPQKNGRAFWSGFLGIFLMWLVFSVFRDISNEHILSARMAKLFHLPGYGLFLVVAAMVGGLVGGLAAWSGAALRGR